MNDTLTDKTVLSRLAKLEESTSDELKELWLRLMGKEPPGYNRSYMLKRLGHKIQEQAYGGLSERTGARLLLVLEQHGLDPVTAKPANAQPKVLNRGMSFPVGFTMRKEYHGQIYTLVKLEGKWWELDGKRFKSISAAAEGISGTHCNGYAFFGLRDYRTAEKTRRFSKLKGIADRAQAQKEARDKADAKEGSNEDA